MMKTLILLALALGLSAVMAAEDDGPRPAAPEAEAAEEPAGVKAGRQPEETETEAEAPAEAVWHHVAKLGGLEIVALLDGDGVHDGKTSVLIGMGADDMRRAAEKDALKTSINAFVVRLNGKTVLFDTAMPPEATGGLALALEEAGISPDAIDAVVITHFHRDHIGGLVWDGKAVFPKAELYLPEAEVNKWSDHGLDFIHVYGARTNAFKAGREILPGVTALAAYGHTPGHTIYRLEAGEGALLIIGDLVHLPGVQLANPDVAVTYDTDPKQAVATRKRVFDKAAEEKLPVAAMHIPFPGLGTLERQGKGYVFTPLGE